jgi:hypothetical protein
MRFSVKYIPTSLFSLKESNSTNSGAKSLFLPSPYCIKMAVINQAITVGNELDDLNKKGNPYFQFIRDAKISYFIEAGSGFCVNNSFMKILKPAREGDGFGQTVSFREYVYISSVIEIIFEVKDENHVHYLKKYLHKINYFGKKGCFFQFLEYSDNPTDSNVNTIEYFIGLSGLIQEFDDFDDSLVFDNINNYSSSKTKRKKKIYVLPLKKISSSKSYSYYKAF